VIRAYFRELIESSSRGWNTFWFQPRDTATLGLIRCLAGCMLFYTHLVWSLDLAGFFSPQGRISNRFLYDFYGQSFAWSHLNLVQSTAMLWCLHLIALSVLFCFMIGLFTRVTSILSFLITVSYAHRAPGALFGLDQINAMLAMYLMIGPSGASYSVDRWLRGRAGERAGAAGGEPTMPSVSANIATRLIQLHLCVIYFFASTGKLQGISWWEGTAMWLAMGNLEYQSLDVTWLGRWPWLINIMTHISLWWELSYSALVWPRLTRPLVLFIAVPLHLGIACCMGMVTFGVIMLVANLAFVSPQLVRTTVRWRPASPWHTEVD